jgi:acetylglutamate kinase
MVPIQEEDLKEIIPADGPSIPEVKSYLDKYNDEYIVIKCGGSVLVDQNLFDHFIDNISILKKLGFIPIVVHGGGKRISNKLSEQGIESKFLNGLRITDEKTIKIAEEVLIEFNKEIVEALNNKQCTAEEINTKKNNIISVIKDDEKLGFVGSPNKINKKSLDKIIEEKKVPVIAPLGLDEQAQPFNINADTAAGYIAKELNARRLIIMSDVEGVLDKEKNLLP